MIPLLKPANTLPGALHYYVAAELLKNLSIITSWPGGGMPADTVILPAARVILSLTCVASPMFRNKVHELACDSAIDVILLRCCLTPGDILPITADVTLAGGGLAPTVPREAPIGQCLVRLLPPFASLAAPLAAVLHLL